MPIYEYECENCKRRFEIMQKMSDPPLVECEECKGKLHKLISSPGLSFKGTGWYVTDYSRKNDVPKKETNDAAKKDVKTDGAPTKTEASKSDTSKKETPKKETPPPASKPSSSE